jgi:hypothetical protein
MHMCLYLSYSFLFTPIFSILPNSGAKARVIDKNEPVEYISKICHNNHVLHC